MQFKITQNQWTINLGHSDIHVCLGSFYTKLDNPALNNENQSDSAPHIKQNHRAVKQTTVIKDRNLYIRMRYLR